MLRTNTRCIGVYNTTCVFYMDVKQAVPLFYHYYKYNMYRIYLLLKKSFYVSVVLKQVLYKTFLSSIIFMVSKFWN